MPGTIRVTNESCFTKIEKYYKSRESEFIYTVCTTDEDEYFVHDLTCALQFFSIFLCAIWSYSNCVLNVNASAGTLNTNVSRSNLNSISS